MASLIDKEMDKEMDDLVNTIGEYALSGKSLEKVLLPYICCAQKLNAYQKNCLTEKTKRNRKFESFQSFRKHIWDDHKIDVTIRCGEIVTSKKKEEEEKLQLQMDQLAIDSSTKAVNVKTTENVTVSVSDPLVEVKTFDYYGVPLTKDEYTDQMNIPNLDEPEEDA
jgi:hypothetical protein